MSVSVAQRPNLAASTTILLTGGTSLPGELASLDGSIEESDVVLDFSRVELVTSADLAVLIRFCLDMRAIDKCVMLSNVAPTLRQLFEITRFVRLATIADDGSVE